MAGRAAIDAFQEARRLKLDERKLKMIEEDTARKASATLLRQQGLSEMKDLIDGGMTFKDALFKVSPKLFVDSPEVLGQIAHQDAVEKATEAYKQATLEINRKAKEAQAQHQANMEEPPEIRLARKTAQLRAEAEQPTTDQGPDTGVAPKSPAAMTLEELRRQQESKTKAKANVKESERAAGLQLIQRERELQALVESQPDNQEWKDMLQKTQDEKQIWEAQQGMTEETTEVTTGPDGRPIVRITKGGTRSKLPAGMTTTAEATKEAEQMNMGRDVLRTLGRLQDDLQPGVVGLGANVSSFIFDKLLPALGVQSASQERILGRQDIRLANQSLMGALSKRFSTTELGRIKEMLPSLGFIESQKDAKLLVSAIQRQIAEENAASARKLKQEPDQQTIETLANLQGVSWQSLAQDVKDGRLDRATYEAVVNYANATKGQNARPANQP